MKINAIAFLLSLLFPATLLANNPACSLANGINVNTAKRILTICKQGAVIKSFAVAIGANGAGKTHRGDNKTPVGLYSLAYPRKSNQFKLFIPIQYPTPAQRAAGYTGRDVGIHGPAQTNLFLSIFSNLPYATRGCIALGKNSYVDYVANWIKANPGSRILIS